MFNRCLVESRSNLRLFWEQHQIVHPWTINERKQTTADTSHPLLLNLFVVGDCARVKTFLHLQSERIKPCFCFCFFFILMCCVCTSLDGFRRTSPTPPPLLRPWLNTVTMHMSKESHVRSLSSITTAEGCTVMEAMKTQQSCYFLSRPKLLCFTRAMWLVSKYSAERKAFI